MLSNLLNLCSSHNCTAGRENTVDRTELFAGTLSVRTHTTLTNDHSDTGQFGKLILELLHTHRSCRSYRNHLVIILCTLDLTNDRAGMENCFVADILDVALVNMEQYNIDKFHNAVLANDQVVFCVSNDHRLAEKKSVTTKDMAKEQLIFFNADSVQNQILKMRFEMDGHTPNIVMRSSQIYTTLQFVKTGKYGCFLYSSMTDNFSTSNVTGIPLNPPVRIKIGMVWKKSKYISGDMLTFLHFTRMYYKEHPLIEK